MNYDLDISAFRKGDKSQFELIFNRYYDQIFYYAYDFLSDRNHAKDITSDCFLKLWRDRDRDTFNNEENIKAYLFHVTKNACIDCLRKDKRTRKVYNDILYRSEDNKNNEEESIIRSDIINALRERIERLPPGCKMVFKLIYFHDLDTTEVAMKLKISNRNVLNQKSKAIRILKNYLKSTT